MIYELMPQGLENIDQDNLGILPALEHESKSYEQLMSETGLTDEVLDNALSIFIAQGFIRRLPTDMSPVLPRPFTPRPSIPKPQDISPPDEGYVTLGSLSPEELSQRTPL